MEHHYRDRLAPLLALVSDPDRVLGDHLRPECRRLGRDAVPAALQCRPGHVPPQLQRHQLAAPHLDRDRFADPERALLRHRIRAGPVALPRPVLVGGLALRQDRRGSQRGHPTTGGHPSRMVSLAGQRLPRPRRVGFSRQQQPRRPHPAEQNARPAADGRLRAADEAVEDDLPRLVQHLEHHLPGVSGRVHVGVEPVQPTQLDDGPVHRAGLSRGGHGRLDRVQRGPAREEDRGSAHVGGGEACKSPAVGEAAAARNARGMLISMYIYIYTNGYRHAGRQAQVKFGFDSCIYSQR